MTHTNPQIHWQDWNPETFARARREDKPILLDIGAVWCHWCHVMDTGIPGDPEHTGTYADPAVQERIAQSFIAVKVDNDKQPDINARYNMGGWPTTAFLTPEGETLYGETYVPPRRMVALLDHISALWQTRRDEITQQTEGMSRQRAEAEAAQTPASTDPQTIPHVLQALRQSWDNEHGGFVTNTQYAPKFPHPAALMFALEQYARAPDPPLRELVVTTLRGMSHAGMYDQHAGGFFRYSTSRDWSIPHYEKMLEDNAKLACVYLAAAHVLGMPEFLNTAQHATDWLLSDLRDPQTGAFAGSQDADAEEAYYGQALSVRAALPTPFIDRTVYAGWNALAVSALAARFQSTREPHILDAARAAFAFLTHHLVARNSRADSHGAVRHFYAHGEAQGALGLLDDQVSFLHAALDLHDITADPFCRECAEQSAQYILSHLQNHQQGGFYDLRPDPQAIGELARPRRDMDANAGASLALLRLYALTSDPQYRAAAERSLRLFTTEYAAMSFFASSYARAIDALTRPPLHIILTGTPGANDLEQMQALAWAAPCPGKAVETPPADIAAARGFPPSPDNAARAYVCIGTACQTAPTPEALAALLACARSPAPADTL